MKLLGFRGCVPNSFNDKYLPSEPLAFPSPQARAKGPQEKTKRSWPRKTGVAFFRSRLSPLSLAPDQIALSSQ